MLSTLFSIALAALPTLVDAHAVVTSPVPRTSGTAQVAACGTAVSAKLNVDKTGPIESAASLIPSDPDYDATACHLFTCRGYQYADNTGRVQSYTAGQVVTWHVDLVAGHRPGYANVSIIDLSTNKPIGSPLVTWAAWPDSTSGPPRNDTDFTTTIPASAKTSCSTAGKCAIQWYWYAINNQQTYESCVDFVVT